jgi:predicted metal-dependent HD superfamily phosphohydrolase
MNYRAAKIFILNKLKTELPSGLSYHGLHHTKDVLRTATALCVAEGVSGTLAKLVKTAALLHDSGFVTNQHAGHEHQGCIIAKNVLPDFGYSIDEIEEICNMIMATKIPQSPKSLVEQILCDADLDYLGRPDFYSIGRSLFDEMSSYHLINDEKAWNRIQISFLSAHRYHTRTNQELREPVKRAYLQELQALVATYDQ